MARTPLNGLIPVIFYLVVSCSPSNDIIDPIPVPQNCLYKSLTNTGVRYMITHNDKELPVRLDFVYANNSFTTTCFIEYDGADHIVKMSQDNGYFKYEYEGERVITREMYMRKDISSPFLRHDGIFYRYNDQGDLDSTIFVAQQHYYRFEYDANGNIIKRYLKYYSAPEVLDQEYLAFDEKKNPALDANFATYIVLGSDPGYQTGLDLPWVSNHNVIDENVRLANGTISNRKRTFEYNDLGFPTYCKETNTFYSYDCK